MFARVCVCVCVCVCAYAVDFRCTCWFLGGTEPATEPSPRTEALTVISEDAVPYIVIMVLLIIAVIVLTIVVVVLAFYAMKKNTVKNKTNYPVT